MAKERRNLIWIPIVLALVGWVLAYVSPLYHETRKKPNVTVQYEEIDFKHFIATRFEIANTGNSEAKEIQFFMPRFIFPGGGIPCSTVVRDISPHHIRFTVDDLTDKRIYTIFHLAPQEKFNFTIYKGCFENVLDYYVLKPTISFEQLIDGIRARTMYGDIEVTEKVKEKKKRRRSKTDEPS